MITECPWRDPIYSLIVDRFIPVTNIFENESQGIEIYVDGNPHPSSINGLQHGRELSVYEQDVYRKLSDLREGDALDLPLDRFRRIIRKQVDQDSNAVIYYTKDNIRITAYFVGIELDELLAQGERDKFSKFPTEK